jgi:hypothetical protein
MRRRKCTLATSIREEVDLRDYEDIILQIIHATVKNKHPMVFKDYFSTDELTQSEAVSLGRALAKVDSLKPYGKTIQTFRLFEGKTYASEASRTPVKKQTMKGGRRR